MGMLRIMQSHHKTGRRYDHSIFALYAIRLYPAQFHVGCHLAYPNSGIFLTGLHLHQNGSSDTLRWQPCLQDRLSGPLLVVETLRPLFIEAHIVKYTVKNQVCSIYRDVRYA